MNDTLSPLVSIIICVYNGEKYLERCLQSAMSQSYKNIEIIVVNDGSMDNTPVIIENYVKLDCRIIVINKQNGGISEARRIGVNRARGKYIQYLDCDDVLMSNAIGCLVLRRLKPMLLLLLSFFVKMAEERSRTAWSLNKCPGLNI